LHIAQQMPLPLTVSCSSKSRLVLTFLVLPFWYLLTRVVPDIFQNSSKAVVCVCVAYCGHFIALVLLVGWHEWHPACKKLSGGCPSCRQTNSFKALKALDWLSWKSCREMGVVAVCCYSHRSWWMTILLIHADLGVMTVASVHQAPLPLSPQTNGR